MRTRPLVSIVTPSFNQSRYIEETLLSVIHQDYPHKEYLVVDGGSTDGSLDIIRKYDRELTWWVSESDLGQADAINKGLRKSRGEIVAWLNSDDYYLPGAVASAVDVLTHNPQTVLVYGDVTAIDARGNFIRQLRYRQMDLVELMCFNIIGQPAVFMRKDSLNKAGLLDVSYKYLLDHQLWLRLALLGQIVHIPKTIAAARFHSESKNVAQAAGFGEEAHRIVQWVQNHRELNQIYLTNRNKVLAGAERINARYLLDGNQPKPAFKAYLRSLYLHPATALKEWYRILFALLTGWGFSGLRKLKPHWRE